jgi:hypothetical protein
MLISMPHGTSTIFGAFQAILALLDTGRSSALANKLAIEENFASEIFRSETCACYVAAQQVIPQAGSWANQTKRSSRVSLAFHPERRWDGRSPAAIMQINNL